MVPTEVPGLKPGQTTVRSKRSQLNVKLLKLNNINKTAQAETFKDFLSHCTHHIIAKNMNVAM